MDRRTFLKTTAAGGAVISIGVTPGCGNNVVAAPLAQVMVNHASDPRAAILNDAPGTAGYGSIQLYVPFYPDLAKVGGAITLHLPIDAGDTNRAYPVPPDGTVLVVQRSEGVFAAFQSSCPHAGCPLGYSAKADQIECPCHSSTFLAADKASQCAGAVLHLPARSALQVWAANFNSNTQSLTIDLTNAKSCNNSFPALVNTTLTLPLADFPQLGMVGGSATGQPSGATDPIVVVRVDANSVAALDARCTHRGCTVLWTPARKDLECPCHGSSFALDGRVTAPPATTALKSYAAMITADAIVVTVA